MRIPARHLLPALLACCFAVLCLATPASAQSGCPSNCAFSNQCTTAPSGSFYQPPVESSPSGSASFDCRTAYLSANQGDMNTDDVFTVDSTPGGAPMVLHLDAFLGGYGANASIGFRVTVPGKGQTSDAVSFGPVGPPDYLGTSYSQHYPVLLSVNPGESFELVAHFYAGAGFGGNNQGFVSGSLRYGFVSVPAGVRLHSCHGFTVDTTTPTHRASWGALKTHYR